MAGTLKLRPRDRWSVLRQTVEDGVRGGLYKSAKYDYLSLKHEDAAVDKVAEYVINALTEEFQV